MGLFADVIIDISHSRLDQTYQYRIPEALCASLEPGNVVVVPFGRGNHPTKGYVLRITECCACPPEKLKDIMRIETSLAGAESKLTALALWMRDYYGSTTVQALRTVLPFRQKAPQKKKKTVALALEKEEARRKLAWYREKHQAARARLLEALIEEPVLPQELVTGSLKITLPTLRAMQEQGILICESEQAYRTPALIERLRGENEEKNAQDTDRKLAVQSGCPAFDLTQEQQRIISAVGTEWDGHGTREYLIHGVTGSGKTAVYIELIAEALSRGQQAILLIPEISLTYQNVIRFYRRFGDRISILHSRLSPSERYDQFERAKAGEIDVMIGPRSALFTPFQNLGIIIIDEEHEMSYRSETVPRYDARQTARRRAQLEGAALVLGSATPSLETYYRTQTGECTLFTMKHRASGGQLPTVETVDMREELQAGNRSILSAKLHRMIEERLEKHQQIMLFLNRRGYSGFVSCRSCGHVIRCPHCDVSLSLHNTGRMVCHYCGYEETAAKRCPSCGSPYIGGFKAGTQQIESLVKETFPRARVLRMDADTTRGKDGHAELLRAFGAREADILVGTQMIVKGHDFPHVTLVGILAADTSLNISDYQAAERTFQLLTQAAGRAGRAEYAGEVVIQTYAPEHYAVVSAAHQDYLMFYEQELRYRKISGYPPCGNMMAVHCASDNPQELAVACEYLTRFLRQAAAKSGAVVIGPADEMVARISDVYRKAVYVKHRDGKALTAIKNFAEQYIEINAGFQNIKIQFERK